MASYIVTGVHAAARAGKLQKVRRCPELPSVVGSRVVVLDDSPTMHMWERCLFHPNTNGTDN